MFIQTLAEGAKKNLVLLGKTSWINKFYLAGGSAISLYFGHRVSVDLDFFTDKIFSSSVIVQRLRPLGEFVKGENSKGTLVGKLNKVKISFFWYPYPLLYKTKKILGVSVADIRDIACMKMDAVSSPGTRRDFIDLYLSVLMDYL